MSGRAGASNRSTQGIHGPNRMTLLGVLQLYTIEPFDTIEVFKVRKRCKGKKEKKGKKKKEKKGKKEKRGVWGESALLLMEKGQPRFAGIVRNTH